MLISLELDNISRNSNGVLTGFSSKKIRIFISYTLYDVKVISMVDLETFLVTPLVGQLEMGIQIRMGKRARYS